tara:strand:+ start:261 stop:479 length:219 start_codon:yes stop_codon:yes gene_type:complete
VSSAEHALRLISVTLLGPCCRHRAEARLLGPGGIDGGVVSRAGLKAGEKLLAVRIVLDLMQEGGDNAHVSQR